MNFSWLNLGLILIAALATGSLASRLGYQTVLGELIVGALLGPPLLGFLQSDDGIATLGLLGVLMMSFYISTRVYPNYQTRSRAATLPLIGSVLVPLLAGYLLMVGLFSVSMVLGLLVGLVMGTTSLIAMIRFLTDLELLETRVGQTLMTIAIFSIVLIMIIFTAIEASASARGAGDLMLVLGKVLLFVALLTLVGMYGYPLLGRAHNWIATPSEVSGLTLAVLLALGAASFAQWLGLSFVLGGFMAGLFLRPEMFAQDAYSKIFNSVRDVARGFLSLIFFVSAGFLVSFAVFGSNPGLVIAISAVALLSKFLGGFLFALPNGRGWHEALVVGLGMNARGSLDIVIAVLALQVSLLSQEVYTALICAIVLSTLMGPTLLRWGSGWLRDRGELLGAEDLPTAQPGTARAGS